MDPIDQAETSRRFTHYPPDAERAKGHEIVRGTLGSLANWLAVVLPEGREKSQAITKLEEVMFWANAAIARNVAED